MDTKKKPDDTLDVSSILENYEEKPIVPVSPSDSEGKDKPLVKKSENKPSYAKASAFDKSTADKPVEELLREDLKMSYTAKGILDVTFGGYGFLRQDYILNPDRDIYVSTSQIRRFWLRRG